jgi:hypothetical protein
MHVVSEKDITMRRLLLLPIALALHALHALAALHACGGGGRGGIARS